MKLRVQSPPFEARYESMRDGKRPPGAEPLLFTALAGLMALLADPVEASKL
jgi:hypothetical protein